MKFGTEMQSKHIQNIRRTTQMPDNNIDLEEWVISLLNNIAKADTYGGTYGLTLSKERVHMIAEAWKIITSVTIV